MPTDLQTFAIVFAAIWGGLGLYLVWIDRAARSLAARVARLEARRPPS